MFHILLNIFASKYSININGMLNSKVKKMPLTLFVTNILVSISK